MQRLKLREIEAFIAVVEEKGIVKASERLFCVPSNISKLINDLEAKCYEKLFNRTQRQLHLTPYGRYFYGQALLFFQETELFAERLFTPHSAKLMIGIRYCARPLSPGASRSLSKTPPRCGL